MIELISAKMKKLDHCRAHMDEYQEILDGLKKAPVTYIDLENDYIYLSVTGTRQDLSAAFAALRQRGFVPDSRPTAKDTSFNTFFRHKKKDIKVLLAFSSTSCRRVKIGTRIQEVDVYEVVCDEVVIPT